MKYWIKNILLLIVVTLVFNSCKQNEVDGIIISETLSIHQTYKENNELRQLIKRTLNKEPEALVSLKDFRCGGASGCYDLGFITSVPLKLGRC